MKNKENEEKKSLGDYGIIFLSGSIDAGTAQSVCQEIIRINIEHSADFVQMIVNSVGGHVSAGFAIIDMMEWSRLPVYTTGVGMVASMGLAIFMAGEKGQRVLTPRTSVLSHRFSGMIAGHYSDLIARRKEEDFLHERLIRHYMEHTSLKTPEEVESVLLRDVDAWLTPEEAMEYGIADRIEHKNRTMRG
jgi:ATP-dependent Clp protease protease subunit